MTGYINQSTRDFLARINVLNEQRTRTGSADCRRKIEPEPPAAQSRETGTQLKAA